MDFCDIGSRYVLVYESRLTILPDWIANIVVNFFFGGRPKWLALPGMIVAFPAKSDTTYQKQKTWIELQLQHDHAQYFKFILCGYMKACLAVL
jgi:hypothetical protein